MTGNSQHLPGTAADNRSASSWASIRNPKRRKSSLGRSDWFPYYAGFSTEFVDDVLGLLTLQEESVLLDPWLGSGTTSYSGSLCGFRTIGLDINPAMLLVSRARVFEKHRLRIARNAIDQIHDACVKRFRNPNPFRAHKDEPIEQWLQPASASAFRYFEKRIRQYGSRSRSCKAPWTRSSRLGDIRALLYLLAFRMFRTFISEFQTSNPTWIKKPEGRRVYVKRSTIINRLVEEATELFDAIEQEGETSFFEPVLRRASSLAIPLQDNSVDAVVTSPPYCTRIDYVRATMPELAVIGFPNNSLQALRRRMLGTPAMANRTPAISDDWGDACKKFLSAVNEHHTKASKTYYSQYYQQYFGSICTSLQEINRVSKSGAKCVMVIQDSHYKDVHIQLPLIITEMGEKLGWTLLSQRNFHVGQTMAGVNPTSRLYRKTFNATESVLVFERHY